MRVPLLAQMVTATDLERGLVSYAGDERARRSEHLAHLVCGCGRAREAAPNLHRARRGHDGRRGRRTYGGENAAHPLLYSQCPKRAPAP